MLVLSWKSDRGRATLSNIDAQCLHRLVLWLLLGIHLSFSRRHPTPRSIYTHTPQESLCLGYTSDIHSLSSSTFALWENKKNKPWGSLLRLQKSADNRVSVTCEQQQPSERIYISANPLCCKTVHRKEKKSIGVKWISLQTVQELGSRLYKQERSKEPRFIQTHLLLGIRVLLYYKYVPILYFHFRYNTYILALNIMPISARYESDKPPWLTL